MDPFVLSHPETIRYHGESLDLLSDAVDEINEAILWLQELQSPSPDWFWLGGINGKVVRQDIDGHLEAAQVALMKLEGDRRIDEILISLGYHRHRLFYSRKLLDKLTLESAIIALSDVLDRSVFTENLQA